MAKTNSEATCYVIRRSDGWFLAPAKHSGLSGRFENWSARKRGARRFRDDAEAERLLPLLRVRWQRHTFRVIECTLPPASPGRPTVVDGGAYKAAYRVPSGATRTYLRASH